jgi:hypothetical protein
MKICLNLLMLELGFSYSCSQSRVVVKKNQYQGF